MRAAYCIFPAAALVLLSVATSAAGELRVAPPIVRLKGPESSLQVLVAEVGPEGRLADQTSEASYRVERSSIATVDERGLLQPRGEGSTTLIVRVGEQQARVPVEVTGIERPAPISFRNDVIPVLTKAGCNSGGCHGKAEGQNGFKLSLFGFDARADYNALVKEARGRRINPAAPARSLLALKATALLPHGGGQALERGSFGYRRLLRWIEEGAAFDAPGAAPVARIEMQPAERVLALGGRQQLRVVAIDAEGERRDVTAEAAYESNAPTIAEVDPRGLAQSLNVPGEAAVLARYMGQVAVCRISVPRPGVEFARPPENNFIDGLVWDKLEQLGVKPSGPCDDATFLRRAYLDTIGTLPTADEARRFLDDPRADKRARLIDALLDRDEYAVYWALRWSDLLRVDANTLGSQAAFAMTRWLREQFARNRPYDAMVRDILTARGAARAASPAPFYLALDKPKELARATSQLFLGVRIACAECHHHPFARWSQGDFYSFAGFFTGVKQKKLPSGAPAVVSSSGADLTHPRTGEPLPAAGLGAEPVSNTSVDSPRNRRRALAAWMTDETNPFFARAIANRLWAHYFGHGLVEPIDDLRATNPATNEPLLDALAEHMRAVDYDLKAFTRTLLNSRVYQSSCVTNATNAADHQQFSHAAFRTLPAEVLLDAICQTTGVPEKFNGWPVGARAIEVWDNRMPSYFFRVFGRPARTTVCACERGDAPSITQALHLMNSPEIAAKVRHRRGRARRLAESDRTPAEIVEQLYLTALSRRPSEDELRLMLQTFEQPGVSRRVAVEDVMWTLLNTKEFLFNH